MISPTSLPSFTLVIDCTAIHPTSGGAGTYVRALVASLPQQGVHPIVIARRNDPSDWPGADRVLRVAPVARPLRLLWEHVGLPKLLGELRSHYPALVLHSPHYTVPRWLPKRVAQVVTIHDLTFFSRPEDHQSAKRVLFRRAIQASSGRADVIIAVSASTAVAYTSQTGRSDRVIVAPHGVDHRRFRPIPKLTSAELAIDVAALSDANVTKPFVLHLGTIEPRKQVHQLCRAFSLVEKQNAASYANLVLAGQMWPGMHEKLPPPLASERRLGFVSDALAATLLRHAAVVVYPSAEEGFGLPILEAMASGAPVIVTDAASSQEVVAGTGHSVALLPEHSFATRLGEALLHASRSAERGSERGFVESQEAAMDRAANFTWERSAELHVAAYQQARRAIAI
jgi:glycosyltransferase involved in cell wall biosynthesis